jgi:hypothetical protein
VEIENQEYEKELAHSSFQLDQVLRIIIIIIIVIFITIGMGI